MTEPLEGQYRYVLTDRAGISIGELQLSDVRIEVGLNGDGQVSASLPVESEVISGPRSIYLDCWASEIVVDRYNGSMWVPLFSGPFTDINSNLGDEALSVTASLPWANLNKRLVHPADGFSYDNKTAIYIAKDVIKKTTTDRVNGNIRVDLLGSDTAGAVLDFYDVNGESRPKTADVVADLAGMETYGFEFEYVFARQLNGITTRTMKFYPVKKDKTIDHKIQLDSGLAGQLGLHIDGANMATSVTVAGDTVGVAALVTTSEDVALSAKYGLLEEYRSFSEIKETLSLDKQAIAERNKLSKQQKIPSFSYIPTAQLPFGFAWVGDRVTFTISRGWYQLNQEYRISRVTVAPSPGGGEEVTYTLFNPVEDA